MQNVYQKVNQRTGHISVPHTAKKLKSERNKSYEISPRIF